MTEVGGNGWKLPLFLGIAFAGGIYLGSNYMGSAPNNKDLSTTYKFREILHHIEEDYVDEVDTEALMEESIQEMLADLDPHSAYINAEDMELMGSQLEGGFDGIGIEFNLVRDTIYVVGALRGGPSEAVGIRGGDRIVSVDGEVAAGIDLTNLDVYKLLRGKKGSKVKVGIKRGSSAEILEYDIIRDKIPQESVDISMMVEEGVGYIKLNRFAATTFDEFQAAIKDLKSKGMTKMILDLQGNTGGYMDRAINIVDELVAGDDVIVFTKSKVNAYSEQSNAFRTGQFEEGAVIVLIDQNSASASEIVSGALQDTDRALIVGRRSFGKGLVQRPFRLDDGSELRLTISRYYTPSGRSIQKSYAEGEDYEMDMMDRYENGEMFNEDSIKNDESLKFETKGGRTVYGGGGIVPDVFVPIDTTYSSAYLNQLFGRNVVREYTLKYVETNRNNMTAMELGGFKDNFDITPEMIEDLVVLGEELGLERNEEQIERSLPLIKQYLKAHLARLIWDSEGFYTFYLDTDENFQEALKRFDEAEALLK